jgi:MOSC domain-containing protein YiiM
MQNFHPTSKPSATTRVGFVTTDEQHERDHHGGDDDQLDDDVVAD